MYSCHKKKRKKKEKFRNLKFSCHVIWGMVLGRGWRKRGVKRPTWQKFTFRVIVFITLVFFCFCRFISPLLLFRWMFILLLSSMPWFWFIGLRKLKMTRLEATVAALCVHSIHSWRKFGLELDAFQEYGIFTQAYGMAVFPLAGVLPLSL